MQSWPGELRLLLAVVANVVVFAAAVRFVRRQGIRHGLQLAADAYLTWYLVQYLAVVLPGLVGWLNVTSMLSVAALLCVLLQCVPVGAPRPAEQLSRISPAERRVVLACAAVAVGLIGAIIWNQHEAPVMANDALTYHLPAAVQWLQSGRIGIYNTWFYNPANTYSPLAGSVFAAWMLAPLGNDVLARFLEAPPLVMVFLVSLQVARCLGAATAVSAGLALAVVCARPFLSQVTLVKDDLFVTAFFATAVLSLARPRLADRLGLWRLGVSLGLLLATKYTTHLSLPLLLLGFDAPHRAGWRWRQYAVAIAGALLLAGPWYLRNLVLTGNPIFPTEVRIAGATILPGMMRLLRSDRLIGAANVWSTFTGGYFSLVAWPTVIVLLVWAGSWVRAGRIMLREPLVRIVLLGPLVGVALFVTTSPYAEIRFAYPSMLLFMLSGALLLGNLRNEIVAGILALLIAAAMIITAFKPVAWKGLIENAAWFVAGAGVGGAVLELFSLGRQRRERGKLRLAAVAAMAAALFMMGYVYVYWGRYLLDLREVRYAEFWTDSRSYGAVGEAWQFVRTQLPAGEKLAYTNVYFNYPLQGFDLDRPIMYAPTRRGVQSVADLGSFDEPTTGENVPTAIIPLTFRNADRDAWLANLRSSGARFLFIGKLNIASPDKPFTPPELIWARQDPALFRPLFDNPGASIFAIEAR